MSVRADGFLTVCELSTRTLKDAITRVTDGDVPISPRLAKDLLQWVRVGAGAAPDGDVPIRITPLEQQVLTLLVEGLSNKQIAKRLGISQHGGKPACHQHLTKLGCPNRTLEVAKALRVGLCPAARPGTARRAG